MQRAILSAAFICLAMGVSNGSAAAQALPYDHIHLNVPDPHAACVWYEQYFGARRLTEGPDRLMFGSCRLVFAKKADAKPSAGSAVDHIAFSFADLDTKMKEFAAAGIKIVTPPREEPGLFKLAFVEDPWGTRIEVVQDPELLGLHHIQIRASNPEEVFTWLLAKFGGVRTKFQGGESMPSNTARRGSAQFGSLRSNAATPSPAKATSTDHLSWRAPPGRSRRPSADFRAQKVTVLNRPMPPHCCPTVPRSTSHLSRDRPGVRSRWSNVQDSNPANRSGEYPREYQCTNCWLVF